MPKRARVWVNAAIDESRTLMSTAEFGESMSLRETLNNLQGAVSAAWTNSPDEYPDWSSWTFETHMRDLRHLWALAEPRLRNRDVAQQVGSDLMKMIAAFESGDKATGRSLAGKLYNRQLSKLS